MRLSGPRVRLEDVKEKTSSVWPPIEPDSSTVLSAACPLHLLCCLSCANRKFFLPPPQGATAPSGPAPPHYRGFTITLRHTHTHSVGLLWTRDQPDAETSTWQHTTLPRDRIHATGRIRTRNPSKRTAADPCLRRRGYRDRQITRHAVKSNSANARQPHFRSSRVTVHRHCPGEGVESEERLQQRLKLPYAWALAGREGGGGGGVRALRRGLAVRLAVRVTNASWRFEEAAGLTSYKFMPNTFFTEHWCDTAQALSSSQEIPCI
jgi:hypothetical protein